MTDLVSLHFSHFKTFSWVLVPLGPRSPGYGCQVLGQQHVFPQCGRSPGTLLLSALFTPGVQGSLPSPTASFPQSHSPPRHATPQLPGADIRQALGERSSICQCIDKEGCFIHGLARAFSHICFYVYFYPELSFLSLGETYILHFVFSFSILTFPPLRTLGKGILHPRRFPPPCWDSMVVWLFSFLQLCLLMLLGFRKERLDHLKSPYNISWFC